VPMVGNTTLVMKDNNIGKHSPEMDLELESDKGENEQDTFK